jgi:hypothetical protein
MAQLALHDAFGNIDLSLITEEAVAGLDDGQRDALSIFIDSVKARQAADVRKLAAEQRVRAAMQAENLAFAAHTAANPAPDRIDALREAQDSYRRNH